MTTASLETFRLPLALHRKLARRARAADVDAAEYTRAAIERGLAVRDVAHEMRAAVADAVTPLRADIDALRGAMREMLTGIVAPPHAPRQPQKDKEPERKRQVDDALDTFFKDQIKNPVAPKKGGKK